MPDPQEFLLENYTDEPYSREYYYEMYGPDGKAVPNKGWYISSEDPRQVKFNPDIEPPSSFTMFRTKVDELDVDVPWNKDEIGRHAKEMHDELKKLRMTPFELRTFLQSNGKELGEKEQQLVDLIEVRVDAELEDPDSTIVKSIEETDYGEAFLPAQKIAVKKQIVENLWKLSLAKDENELEGFFTRQDFSDALVEMGKIDGLQEAFRSTGFLTRLHYSMWKGPAVHMDDQDGSKLTLSRHQEKHGTGSVVEGVFSEIDRTSNLIDRIDKGLITNLLEAPAHFDNKAKEMHRLDNPFDSVSRINQDLALRLHQLYGEEVKKRDQLHKQMISKADRPLPEELAAYALHNAKINEVLDRANDYREVPVSDSWGQLQYEQLQNKFVPAESSLERSLLQLSPLTRAAALTTQSVGDVGLYAAWNGWRTEASIMDQIRTYAEDNRLTPRSEGLLDDAVYTSEPDYNIARRNAMRDIAEKMEDLSTMLQAGYSMGFEGERTPQISGAITPVTLKELDQQYNIRGVYGGRAPTVVPIPLPEALQAQIQIDPLEAGYEWEELSAMEGEYIELAGLLNAVAGDPQNVSFIDAFTGPSVALPKYATSDTVKALDSFFTGDGYISAPKMPEDMTPEQKEAWKKHFGYEPKTKSAGPVSAGLESIGEFADFMSQVAGQPGELLLKDFASMLPESLEAAALVVAEGSSSLPSFLSIAPMATALEAIKAGVDVISGEKAPVETPVTSEDFVDIAWNYKFDTVLPTTATEEEKAEVLIDAYMKLTRMSHSAIDFEATQFDTLLQEISDSSVDEFVRDFAGENTKIVNLPVGLEARLRGSTTALVSPAGTPEELTKEAWDKLTLGELFAKNDAGELKHQIGFTDEDLKDWVDGRRAIKETGAGKALHFLMDAGFEDVYDPTTRVFTKKVTPLGYLMNGVSPLPPRLILEGVRSGTMAAWESGIPAALLGIEPYVAEGSGWNESSRWWTNWTNPDARIISNIVVGDPGNMGEFEYLAVAAGWGEPAVNFAKNTGLGFDWLVNWEARLLRAAGRPIKTAKILRDASQTRRAMQIPDASPWYKPTPETIEYMLADGTVQPWYLEMNDRQTTGVQMASAIAGGAVSSFVSAVVGMDPLSGFFLGAYGARQIVEPSRSGVVGPLARRFLKRTGLPEGFVAKYYPDVVQVMEFRRKQANGTLTFNDNRLFMLERSYKDVMKEGGDIFDFDQVATRMKLRKGSQEWNEMESVHRDFKDKSDTMLRKLGLSIDDVRHINTLNAADSMPIIMQKMAQYQKDAGHIPKAIVKSRGYKTLNSQLEQELDKKNITELERDIILAWNVVWAESLMPGNPARFFEQWEFAEDKQGLHGAMATDVPVATKPIDKSFDDMFESVESHKQAVEDTSLWAQNFDSVGLNRIQAMGSREILATTESSIGAGVPIDKHLEQSFRGEISPLNNEQRKKVAATPLTSRAFSEGEIFERFPDSNNFEDGDYIGLHRNRLYPKGVLRADESKYLSTNFDFQIEHLPSESELLAIKGADIFDSTTAQNKRRVAAIQQIEDAYNKSTTVRDEVGLLRERTRKRAPASLVQLDNLLAENEALLALSNDVLGEQVAKSTVYKRADRPLKDVASKKPLDVRKFLAGERRKTLDKITKEERLAFKERGARFRVDTKMGKAKVSTYFRYRRKGRIMVIETMSSTYPISERFRGLGTDSERLVEDFHYRKLAAYEALRFAGENGMDRVLFPTGDLGMFNQLHGSGTVIGDRSKLVHIRNELADLEGKIAEITDKEMPSEKETEKLALSLRRKDFLEDVKKEVESRMVLKGRPKLISSLDTAFQQSIKQMVEEQESWMSPRVYPLGQKIDADSAPKVAEDTDYLSVPVTDKMLDLIVRDPAVKLRNSTVVRPSAIPEEIPQIPTGERLSTTALKQAQEVMSKDRKAILNEIRKGDASRLSGQKLNIMRQRADEILGEQEAVGQQIRMAESGVQIDTHFAEDLEMRRIVYWEDPDGKKERERLVFGLKGDEGQNIYAIAIPAEIAGKGKTAEKGLIFEQFVYGETGGRTSLVQADLDLVMEAVEDYKKPKSKKLRKEENEALRKKKKKMKVHIDEDFPYLLSELEKHEIRRGELETELKEKKVKVADKQARREELASEFVKTTRLWKELTGLKYQPLANYDRYRDGKLWVRKDIPKPTAEFPVDPKNVAKDFFNNEKNRQDVPASQWIEFQKRLMQARRETVKVAPAEQQKYRKGRQKFDAARTAEMVGIIDQILRLGPPKRKGTTQAAQVVKFKNFRKDLEDGKGLSLKQLSSTQGTIKQIEGLDNALAETFTPVLIEDEIKDRIAEVNRRLVQTGQFDALARHGLIPHIGEGAEQAKRILDKSRNETLADAGSEARTTIRKIISKAVADGYSTFSFTRAADNMRQGVVSELSMMGLEVDLVLSEPYAGTKIGLGKSMITIKLGTETERARRLGSLAEQYMENHGVRSIDPDIMSYMEFLNRHDTDVYMPEMASPSDRTMDILLGMPPELTVSQRKIVAQSSDFLYTAVPDKSYFGLDYRQSRKLRDMAEKKLKYFTGEQGRLAKQIREDLKERIEHLTSVVKFFDKATQIDPDYVPEGISLNGTKEVQFTIDGEKGRAVVGSAVSDMGRKTTVIYGVSDEISPTSQAMVISKFLREAAAKDHGAVAFPFKQGLYELKAEMQAVFEALGFEKTRDRVKGTDVQSYAIPMELKQHLVPRMEASAVRPFSEPRPYDSVTPVFLHDLFSEPKVEKSITFAEGLQIKATAIIEDFTTEQKEAMLDSAKADTENALADAQNRRDELKSKLAEEPTEEEGKLQMLAGLQEDLAAAEIEITTLNRVLAEQDYDLPRSPGDLLLADDGFIKLLKSLHVRLSASEPMQSALYRNAPLVEALRAKYAEEAVQHAINYMFNIEAMKIYAREIKQYASSPERPGPFRSFIDIKFEEPESPAAGIAGMEPARILREVEFAGRPLEGRVGTELTEGDAEVLDVFTGGADADGYRFRDASSILPVSRLDSGLTRADLIAVANGIGLESVFNEMSQRLADLRAGKPDRLRMARAILSETADPREAMPKYRVYPLGEDGLPSPEIAARNIELEANLPSTDSITDRIRSALEEGIVPEDEVVEAALHYIGFNRYNLSDVEWGEALFKRIVSKTIPSRKADAAQGNMLQSHPSRRSSPIVSLLEKEYRNRNMAGKSVEEGPAAYKWQFNDMREWQESPVQRKQTIAVEAETRALSQAQATIESLGDILQVRLPPKPTVENFLFANAALVERLMPKDAYRFVTAKFGREGHPLTAGQRANFVESLVLYMNTGKAPNGQLRTIFRQMFGVLDRFWWIMRDLPTMSARERDGTIKHKTAQPMENLWNATFVSGRRSFKAALEYVGDNYVPMVKQIRLGEPDLRELDPRLIRGQSKEAMRMSQLTTQQILRDLNNPIWAQKFEGMETKLGEEGQTLKMANYEVGDAMDPADLLARVGALAMNEILEQKGVGKMADMQQLTRRTAVDRRKIEQIQLGAKQTLESVLGETMEEFSKKIKYMDEETFRIAEQGTYRPIPYFEMNEKTFDSLRRLADLIGDQEYVAKMIPEVLSVLDDSLVKADLGKWPAKTVFAKIKGNGFGRKIGNDAYLIKKGELDALQEAVLDTIVPLQARRTADLSAWNENAFHLFANEMKNLMLRPAQEGWQSKTQKSITAGAMMAAGVAPEAAIAASFPTDAAIRVFQTSTKRMRDIFSAVDLEKVTSPAIAEAYARAEGKLLNMIPDLQMQIEQAHKTLAEYGGMTSSERAVGNEQRTTKLMQSFADVFDGMAFPVPAETLPLLLKLHGRTKNLSDPSGATHSVKSFLSEQNLNSMYHVLHKAGRISAAEHFAHGRLVDMSKMLDKTTGGMKSLDIETATKLYQDINVMKEGLNRRIRDFDRHADIIIQATTGFSPEQMNIHQKSVEVALHRKLAYTLLYHGRISKELDLFKTFHYENSDAWEAKTGTELNYEGAIDWLRNFGVGLENFTDSEMQRHINKKLEQAEPPRPPINKNSSKKELLKTINAVASPEARKTPRSLVEFAEDMGSRAFAIGGKSQSGDPVAIMSSIMLGFKRESVLKTLSQDLIQAGMPEMHALLRKSYDKYGFQYIMDETVLADRIMHSVQNKLNFQSVSYTKEGVATPFKSREPGKSEWRRRQQLESFGKVDIGPNFEILVHKGEKIDPWRTDIDALAAVMSEDLIARSGLKPRGLSNFDRMVRHELPDGSIVMIHETLKEQLDQLIDLVNPGQALGYLDTGVRHDVIRSIDADLTVKSYNAKIGMDELAVVEPDKIQSRSIAVGRAVSKTLTDAIKSGALIGIGSQALIGAPITAMALGAVTGAALMPILRGAYEAAWSYRTDIGLSSVDADLAAITLQAQYRRILLQTSKQFKLSDGLRDKLLEQMKNMERRQGFKNLGKASGGRFLATAGVATAGILAGHGLAVPLLAMGAVRAMDTFNPNLFGVSKFTAKQVHESTIAFIRKASDELGKNMEFPEDAIAIQNIENHLKRAADESKSYAKAVEEGRLETGLSKELAENKAASTTMEWHENAVQFLSDVEGLTAHLKFAVTSLRTTAYWASNFIGLFQQSIMGQGLTPENMGFLAGGYVGGAGFGVPGALVGAQVGRVGGSLLAGTMKEFNRKLQKAPIYKTSYDVMNSVFGGKMNIYGGPSSFHRSAQITQIIFLKEKTPAGVLAGAYGAMAGGAFGGPAGAFIGGVAGAAAAVADKVGGEKNISKRFVLDPLNAESVAHWKPVITPSGRMYTLGEIMQEMEANKVFSTFVREETGRLAAQELRDTNPGFMRNAVATNGAPVVKRMLMDIADSMDLYYRVGMFIDLLEEGKSPKEAGEQVRLIYFDYSDLSDTEKKYFRNIFMFYSFARKNLALYMHMLYNDPAKIMGWFRLQRDLQIQAYNTTNPELFIDDWYLGRLPIPFFNDALRPTGIEGQTIPSYDGSTVISPIMGHHDSFHLLSLLPSLFQGDVNTAMKYAFSQVTPLINIATIGLTQEIPFSGMPVESLEINPQQILIANQLSKVGGPKLFGPDGYIDYKHVSLKERMGEDYEKSKDALAREYLNQKAPHAFGMGKFEPMDKESGMNYYLLDQIAMPVLAGKPWLGPLAFLYGGPSGKLLSNIDKGDLLTDVREDEQRRFHQQWGRLSASIEILVNITGAYTTTEMLAMAEVSLVRKFGQNYNKELLRDEYREIFLKHVSGEEAGMIFDLYISPSNVDKSFWENKMLGLRTVPVRAPEAALDNQVDIMLREARDR